jgi:ABC-type bacteriocin/lantibiotic exporter with double-glycine peptidase domain
MGGPDLLSTIVVILFLVVPVLLILMVLDRTRKRNDEMRDLQKETNRLLSEIASLMKDSSK